MDKRFLGWRIMLIRLGYSALGALALLASACTSAEEAAYPAEGREVRHIIPWRAGGGTDAAMRGFMDHFERHLGVPVITENVPGGLSSVGLTAVQNARPDGYTLGTMTYDALTVEVLGLAPVSWRSFAPICMVTDHPSALIVTTDRWTDLEAFRAAAAAEPSSITVGNVGLQGIWHQHAAAMEGALDIELRHIPYEGGSGPQLAAILGGEVDAIVSSLPAAMSYVREGTLSVLAVMANERNPLVPATPTFTELGFDVVYGGFRMAVAPAETPPVVLAMLEAACKATAEDPDFQSWADGAGIGAAWRDRAGALAYLEELAPKVERLMAEMSTR
jgi:tripartite-type tricarboxylate transporter receptor subunit TctC